MSVVRIIRRLQQTPEERTTLFRIHVFELERSTRGLTHPRLCPRTCGPKIYAVVVPAISPPRTGASSLLGREFFTFTFRQSHQPVRDIFHSGSTYCPATPPARGRAGNNFRTDEDKKT